MARPKETGLKYFPMDTGVFNDRKIRRLLKVFGAKGYLIYSFVLCAIYRDKGYYVQCDSNFLFDVADSLSLKENAVKEVINFCVTDVLLFNQRVFDVEKVLTSSGIQKRYLEVKARSSVEILERFRVIDAETGVNAEETGVNATITPINAAKIPQKKSKVNKKPPIVPLEGDVGENPELSFEHVWELYERKGNKKTSKQRWANLKNHCREAALKHIPLYVKSTPDLQFRKNFEVYINKEAWNDKIVERQPVSMPPSAPETYIAKIKPVNDDE
jgi:hypothetical protein